jgi:Collagen triple helix repeat (20 copies)
MLSRLREQLGTAGLIVAIVALVAAVGGSAIAATNATDSKRNNRAKKNKKKKQKGVTVAQVRKIAKQEAKKFANSNPGPAGPQGPAGANGNDGANGSNGADGSNGSNGSDGKEGKQGPQGDQGLQGDPGLEGSPWTAGGTLPSGKMETGEWSLDTLTTGTFTTLSFPIPLAQPISGSANFKLVPADGSVAQATGTGDLTANKIEVKNVTTETGSFIVGATVSGTGIPAGTTITEVISATEFLLSKKVESGKTATGAALTAKLAPSECENADHAGLASVENPEAAQGKFCLYTGGGSFGKFGMAAYSGTTTIASRMASETSRSGVLILSPSNEEANAGAFGPATGTWAVSAP